MSVAGGFLALALASAGVGTLAHADTATAAGSGAAIYAQHCAFCHEGAAPEAPLKAALRMYDPARIVQSLTSGVMSVAGLPLSESQMRDVAFYLTGRQVEESAEASPDYPQCAAAPAQRTDNAGSWTSWGGTGNARHQDKERVINAGNVDSLSLAWAFAFPGATRVRSQPTVDQGIVYIGSQSGTVWALDAKQGCVHWTFEADSEVRGAPALSESGADRLLLFGDFSGQAYAVDASDGTLRWKRRVHEHPLATITGSVAVDGHRVYVPVSSSEVVPASQPNYACCSFRGALVALDKRTGDEAWRYYTTPVPQRVGENAAGTPSYGPSGAPIWSTPTIDVRRGLVIATTGQNYSSPATGTSDAVIAIDSATGAPAWVTQVTQGDAWNGACVRQSANCPRENGPDFDIGASAVLLELEDGKDLVLAGQKSGMVYALDPEEQGAILWKRRVGSGGTMGGVHWGMSSGSERLYVGVSDQPTGNRYAEGEPQPGVQALNPRTGEVVWKRVFSNRCEQGTPFLCWPGISAAVSSTGDLVFLGGMDGMLRAVDAASGETLWKFDTRREFAAIGGAIARGGAIEADGPVIADGRLFVTSGYDKWGEMPGNALLVFQIAQ